MSTYLERWKAPTPSAVRHDDTIDASGLSMRDEAGRTAPRSARAAQRSSDLWAQLVARGPTVVAAVMIILGWVLEIGIAAE